MTSGSRDVVVVIPAHDAAPWLAAALDSVVAVADRLAEVVVVDDASTDGTAVIAASYGDPVRVLSLQGGARGPAAARNAAVAASTAPYVALADSDDLWVAGRPDPRLALLDSAPEVGVASGAVQPFTDAGPFGPVREGPVCMASIVRRTTWEAVGGMDESLMRGEDVDFLVRVRESGIGVATVPDVTTHYRIRPDQLSRDRAASNTDLLGVVHAAIQRRRRTEDGRS